MCSRSRLPVWFIWDVPDPVDRYLPMANRNLFEKFEVRSSLRSDTIVITTDGRTDRHTSNVLEFCADQMSPRNLWCQINISKCYTCIDKTNIHSVKGV